MSRVLDGYLPRQLAGGRQVTCKPCIYSHLARACLLDGYLIGRQAALLDTTERGNRIARVAEALDA